MPLLSAGDPLPGCPRRIAVAGTSGSGKTRVAATVGAALRVPHIEIDSLYHGPGWAPRPSFSDDVARFVAEPEWVTEWQYDQVRALIAERAELMVWLDLSRSRVLQQVIRRTVQRRLRRQELWNGNREQPLWTVLTDREHIVRWAWSTHPATADRMRALLEQRPGLDVVRLENRRAVQHWIAGPLRAAAARCGGGD
jgi:adenylate kinase family enzyme